MNKIHPWAEYLDEFKRAAKRSSALATARDNFLRQARRTLKLPLIRRVYCFDAIGRHRTWLDIRSKPLHEPARTIFALAMSDHATNSLLATELPMLAAAARLSGSRPLIKRIHDQLHELAAWSPLQRPGWCAYNDRLPPDGKDGNWLATGTGVRAIADTLEIMGRDRLPPATVARLDQLLAAEIVSIVDDWSAKRPWFVKRHNTLTNQWALPTEGLIRACLVLGRTRHADAYALGVSNLMAALNGHAAQGAFEEGIHYADFTVSSLVSAACAMALDNDSRAIVHPFLQNFPHWALHHFQPGGFFINAFDAFCAARNNRAMLKSTLALLAVCLDSRDALWALDNLAGGPDNSLPGLVSHILKRPARRPAPVCFGSYQRAARVNWRNSWDPQATGIWVRGGDRFDQHDHMDRGHVNFILRGQPVFIEAGTPAYHNPRLGIDYATGRGHNVLQLGTAEPFYPKDYRYIHLPGWQKAHTLAPIKVHWLDRRGGDITVNGTAGYDGLKQWLRRVRWDTAQLEVDDWVRLPNNNPQVVVFRWHLGTSRTPAIRINGKTASISWTGIRLELSADSAFKIRSEAMPDHTLQYRDWDDKRPDHLHTCLVIQTTRKVRSCRMKLKVKKYKRSLPSVPGAGSQGSLKVH